MVFDRLSTLYRTVCKGKEKIKTIMQSLDRPPHSGKCFDDPSGPYTSSITSCFCGVSFHHLSKLYRCTKEKEKVKTIKIFSSPPPFSISFQHYNDVRRGKKAKTIKQFSSRPLHSERSLDDPSDLCGINPCFCGVQHFPSVFEVVPMCKGERNSENHQAFFNLTTVFHQFSILYRTMCKGERKDREKMKTIKKSSNRPLHSGRSFNDAPNGIPLVSLCASVVYKTSQQFSKLYRCTKEKETAPRRLPGYLSKLGFLFDLLAPLTSFQSVLAGIQPNSCQTRCLYPSFRLLILSQRTAMRLPSSHRIRVSLIGPTWSID